MEARIIGPEDELGDVRAGLHIQGHHLTREWSKIDPEPGQLAKLQGNKYVDLRGGKTRTENKAEDTSAEVGEDTVKARLDELGVSYSPKATPKALRAALDKAEKAQAKAEQEAQDAAAEAERLAAEADPLSSAADQA